MSKKKSNSENGLYENNRIKIFNSFEEQAAYELQAMSELSPEQILQQMRMFINTAFAMHGYDPENLPEKHSVKIILK